MALPPLALLAQGMVGIAQSARDFSRSTARHAVASSHSTFEVLLVVLGVMVVVVTTVVIFLTELTSNTATAAAFLPVVASLAVGIGADPMLLAIPTALAASCAFMMPVATPPNAIVYGTGRMTIPQMATAGMWVNIIFVILIPIFVFGLAARLFGT